MKVLRSTLVAAVAFVAAACGDKVTVQGPSASDTAPSVTSVTVTPASVTLSIGQSVTFTAVVDVKNGAATTVTWSSAAAAVTVSAAGAATAVSATPGVAVCATSTADANKKGCATVVVSAAPTTIPATVSIQSITLNGNLNAPVNPANVVGIIDVTANVSPGTETVTKVVVLVGTTRADSQTFTAANSAALRFAAEEAMANQSAFPPIRFTINTAKFNATTGVAAWINGNYAISLQLYTSASATAARSTATYQTPLTFNNVDTYVATVATSGTTANATSATGFRYDRGSITATALPVAYSGRVVAAATLLFGSACDASGTGQRNIAMTAPAAGSSAWTATLPTAIPGGGAAVNTVNNYEFAGNSGIAACTALNPTGESIAVTATDAAGDALFAAAVPSNVNALTSLRLDNRAPAVGNGTVQMNPNSRGNGWVNASVGFTSRNTGATSNNLPIRPAAAVCAPVGVFVGTAGTFFDCGEGSYSFQVRAGPNTTGFLTDVRSLTPTTTFTLPARSLTSTTYCALFTAVDALGNEALLTAGQAAANSCFTAPAGPLATVAGAAPAAFPNSVYFGVDLDAPTIAMVGSATVATALDANERRGAAGTVTNNFTVQVGDTGNVGNSGMLGGTGVFGTVQLRNDASVPALTAAQKCVTGLDGNGNCSNVAIGVAPIGVGGILATTAAQAANIATPGYVTFTALGRDAAGNSTANVTRVIAFNLPANVPSLTTALYNTPLTGSTVVFNANSSSNFDLWKSTYNMTYAGSGLVGPILFAPAILNSFNGTQLFSNAPAGITLNSFMRQVELVTGNAPLTTGGGFKPTQLQGIVTDQANVASAAANTAIPGAAVTTGVLYTAATAPLLTRSWSITNTAPATGISIAGTTVGAPTSVVLNADAFGPTATYNAPFTRVDFYATVGANLEQIGTVGSYITTDDGSPFGRRHRASITWTPGATSPVSGTAWATAAAPGAAVNLWAIGVNANGDALVSPVNAAIGLVP